MSFRDVGRRWRNIIENKSSETTIDEKESESKLKEDSLSNSLGEQIDGALIDKNRERQTRKEKELVEQSNTVQRYNTPRKRRTAFSKLNDEIVQFQKMINELKKGMANDVATPESQWSPFKKQMSLLHNKLKMVRGSKVTVWLKLRSQS
mmetsp:Transcript_22827/g.25162  ORF Transcript_22827/g.25162 Transcript_22827/m.25162 type:complete len:149 (+) Transcript_22827:186-632(+)